MIILLITGVSKRSGKGIEQAVQEEGNVSEPDTSFDVLSEQNGYRKENICYSEEFKEHYSAGSFMKTV